MNGHFGSTVDFDTFLPGARAAFISNNAGTLYTYSANDAGTVLYLGEHGTHVSGGHGADRRARPQWTRIPGLGCRRAFDADQSDLFLLQYYSTGSYAPDVQRAVAPAMRLMPAHSVVVRKPPITRSASSATEAWNTAIMKATATPTSMAS